MSFSETKMARTLRKQYITMLVAVFISAVYMLSPWSSADIKASFNPNLNPVVSKAEWELVDYVDNGVIISATAHKRRECHWRKTSFFTGFRRSGVPMVDTITNLEGRHLSKPMVRGVGQLEWEKIFLLQTPEQFKLKYFYADAYHFCGGADNPSNWVRSRFLN